MEELQQRIAALEAELASMRQRLEAREAETVFRTPLRVVDQDGHTFFMVASDESVSTFILLDGGGNPAVSITVSKTGLQRGMLVFDADRNPAVTLGATSRGTSFDLQGHNGQPVVSLGTDGSKGSIAVRNEDGSEAVGLTSADEGGRMALYDRDGNPITVLHGTGDGSALDLFNREQRHVVRLGADAESGTGALTFYDEDGRVVYSAPEGR
jgi:hypothetical protein